MLEIDTPVLGRTTVTDVAIESLATTLGDATFYLQTSPEYHMKRLLAAGSPSIVRIGPVFRADEAGRLHNPEFIMVEWYRLGFDLPRLMDETAALVDCVLGVAPYRRLRHAELLGTVGVAPGERDAATLAAAAAALGTSGDFLRWSVRALRDYLVSEAIARLGRGRFFVTDYPADEAALARVVQDAGGAPVAARFELIVDGIEIANGYDELADAEVLSARMEADRAARRDAGQRVPDVDDRLLDALRAGLPACAGVALGFDRLLMLALGARSLEAVMPFPITRA